MAQIDGLPPLREVIREFGLETRKSFGQNYLLDLNLTSRISTAAGPLENCTVLEIGPGPGGLTRALLANGAGLVVAVEKDSRFSGALEQISQAYPDRLNIILKDALELDREDLPSSAVRIIANLPYNVATPLLVNWLSAEPWPPWWESMTLMFQKEVAERITAQPNSKSYGRLSVIAGWRTSARKLFDVSPSAFVPPPKVTSAVVHMLPRSEFTRCSVKDLEKVTAAAFGQRRKMLRSSLNSLGIDTARMLAECNICETDRADAVPVEGYVALAREYCRQMSISE